MEFLKRNVVTKHQRVFLNHKILNYKVFLLFRALVKKKLLLFFGIVHTWRQSAGREAGLYHILIFFVFLVDDYC